MRVELTVTKARELRLARIRARRSQYQLADELGWVRSKVKRLEKGEVKSIDLVDLMTLERTLNVPHQRPDGVRAVPAPSKKEERVEEPMRVLGTSLDGVPVTTTPQELFDSARSLERGTKNTAYFEVQVKKQCSPNDLLGQILEIKGVKGIIRGVEHNQNQNPIPAGDKVNIMLWNLDINKARLVRKK